MEKIQENNIISKTNINRPMTSSPKPQNLKEDILLNQSSSPRDLNMKNLSPDSQFLIPIFDDNSTFKLQSNHTSSPMFNYFTGSTQSQISKNNLKYSPKTETYSYLNKVNDNCFNMTQNIFQPNQETEEKTKEITHSPKSFHTNILNICTQRKTSFPYSSHDEEEEEIEDNEDQRFSFVLSIKEDNEDTNKTTDKTRNTQKEENHSNDFQYKNQNSSSNNIQKNMDNKNTFNSPNMLFNYSNLSALKNKKPSDYYSINENKDNFSKFDSNNIYNYYFSPIINQMNYSNVSQLNTYKDNWNTQPTEDINKQNNFNTFNAVPVNNMNTMNNMNAYNPANISMMNFNLQNKIHNNYIEDNNIQFQDYQQNVNELNYNPNFPLNSFIFQNQNPNYYITSKNNKHKKIKRINPITYVNESFEYFSENLLELGKDQMGCRFIQKKIEDEPISAKNHLFPSMIKYATSLMKDPFGNYLVQKIISYLSESEISQLIDVLKNDILEIGVNNHGTRVLQHLTSYLKSKPLIMKFIQIIIPFVIPLIKDSNGSHIVLKLANDFPYCFNDILEIICNNCEELSTHRQSCCFIQKLLNMKDSISIVNLSNKLAKLSSKLIVDQYGNYVIQSLIRLGNKDICHKIAEDMIYDIVNISIHKYSSNVLEKCFDYGSDKTVKKLIAALYHKSAIETLILNEHGNYVVQKILRYCSASEKVEIFKQISSLVPRIKSLSFGDKLLYVLINDYPEASPYLSYKDINSVNKGSN